MKEKSLKIFAIATASISLVLGGAIFANKTVSSAFFNADANDTHSLVLNSSTSTGLTSEYGNGTFTKKTLNNNDVNFEYNQGKAYEGGLIVLNKSYVGNANSDYCYIGNTSPITSVSSINVNFNGGILTVFASNDESNFYKVDVLTETGSTTLGNGYLYFRFVNGNQTMNSEISISNITFTYQCEKDDYSSEASDISNVFTLNGAASLAGGVELDDTMHSSVFNGKQSIKITSPITVDDTTYAMGDSTSSKWQFGFHLPRVFRGSELFNMKLSMMINTEFTSKGDGKTVELRIYPSNKYWTYVDSSVCVKVYPSAQKTGWNAFNVDFSSSSKSLNSDDFKDVEFSYLFIRPNHVAPVESAEKGYLYVDELRLQYIDNYPEFDSSAIDNSPEEVNDISNGAFVSGYSANDDVLDYIIKSTNSYRSRKVVPTDDTCRWHYDGFLVDMAGKTISFDAKLETSNAYMQLHLFHNDGGTDYRYTIGVRHGTEAGVTIEELAGEYAGWKHYVVDFDEAMVGATKAAKPSGTPANFGFGVAHSNGVAIHIDNIYITTND